ncbi:capsid polyprotein [Bemisia-associated dicistrovirus 2]|nr:capsid polyprotein [Bemisia-associated dicistrovirus 2]
MSNKGHESGQADVSTTETAWGGADHLDEWDNGPQANHVKSEGKSGGTLLGPSESKKYNDASGFVSEGKVETKVMDQPPEETKLLKSLHPKIEQQHSIERILSRPVKIATLTFNSQSNPGQLIGSFDIIPTIQNNSRFRLLREKLSSFYGVNMTAHLKVTLNPQPMESGLFQIFFIPYLRSEGSPVAPDQFTNNFEAMLPFTTGCPNIPCNISKQSEVELAVPYTGPIAFINLTNSFSDFGKFYIQTIVPISDQTNNASCELSVYMYFTHVKLFGTSANSVIASTQGLEDIKPSECEEDAMKKKKGPLTQIGNSLLPVLDSLGLSAPDSNPNVDRMLINPFNTPTTVDSTNSPLKLSYLFKHHLDIGQLGVNTKVDEMDLTTIAFKPCYYNQFTWNTAQEAETRLITYPVEPNCQIKVEDNTPAPTRFRYVANNFRYWRGTVRFLFMVVANQYHSGRLRFVYSLGGNLPSSYVDNYPRTFTQVVDIRKGAHFIIECPYFASTPWRLVPQIWDNTRNIYTNVSALGNLDDRTATLDIFVENELRATSTTSTSVQIVCMQSCGSDFEFACPIAPRSRPYVNLAVPDGAVAEPQGLDFMPLDMASGLSSSHPMSTKPHKFTVGEDINSVRQLIKRYQLIGSGTATGTTTYVVYPFAVTQPEGVPTLSYDHLAVFSFLYQFRRGSIRYMFVPNKDVKFMLRYDPEQGINDVPTVDTGLYPFGDVAPVRAVTAFPSGVALENQYLTATVPFDVNLQGGMEVEFPYYSRFHKMKTAVFPRNALNATYANQIRQGRVPAGIAYFRNRIDSGDYVVDVYRCAADDFTLGYLLGAPFTIYRDRL